MAWPPCLWYRAGQGRSHEGTHSQTDRLTRSEEREQRGGRWEVGLQSVAWAGDTGTETFKALGFRGAAQSARRRRPRPEQALGGSQGFLGRTPLQKGQRRHSAGACFRPSVAHRTAHRLLSYPQPLRVRSSHGTGIHQGRRGPRQPPGVWAGVLGNRAGGRLGLSPLPQPPKLQGAEPRSRASFRP